MKAIYTMEFRPIGFGTLPRDIITDWVRLPKLEAHTLRNAFPDREVSDHVFGEFTTNRPLTAEEMKSYQVRLVNSRREPPTGTILHNKDFAAVMSDDGFHIAALTDAGRERLAEHWQRRSADVNEIGMVLAGSANIPGRWSTSTVFDFVDTWDALTDGYRIQ